MKSGFLLRRIEVTGGSHRFRVYVPSDYSDQTARPAVLFLHGAGERGSDSIAPTKVGIGPHLKSYPALVLFPQCPAESHWSAPEARAIATAALDLTASEFRIDGNRIALTGISMGGAGAWLLAGEQPQRFARLAPVCGWLSSRVKRELPVFAQVIARIPTWMFHGDSDPVVPVDESRLMYAALQGVGADVQYTELPGVAHNSWDSAYGESDLLDWLIS